MAQRKSTGLVNFLAAQGSARQALGNARICVYTGTQPTTADDPITGTLLVTLTKGGGAFTGETLATWKFTLSGSAGSITSVTIGGVPIITSAIPFTTDLNTTALTLANAITNTYTQPDYIASASGATITVVAPVGTGSTLNSLNIVVTTTTLVTTYEDTGATGAPFSLGVSAVNGCNFQYPAVDGILSKEATDWSGVAVATGTAGWFRIKADASDNDALSTTYVRLDGNISTSGAEMNLSSLLFTSGGTYTITSGSFTMVK